MAEQQDLLPPIPPRERTIVEGNLVEHPLWKLSKKQAKPLRTVIDEKTGQKKRLPDPADYTLTIDLEPDPDAKQKQLIIEAGLHSGYPTVFAFRVLVVVVEKAHALGYASQRVPITPTEILQGLDTPSRGGKNYAEVYDALAALEDVKLCYVDTYFDATIKGIYPGRRTERLVKKVVFKARRGTVPTDNNATVDTTLVLPGLPTSIARRSSTAPPSSAGEPDEYVELGDGLWTSLTAGYRFPVDREYLNRLGDEMAQRLYVYLAKKDRDSPHYEERIVLIGRKLGLAKLAPSHILEALEPACRVLREPLAPDGKHFLRSFSFEGKRSATILKVETNREQDFDPEQRAAEQRAKDITALRQKLAQG